MQTIGSISNAGINSTTEPYIGTDVPGAKSVREPSGQAPAAKALWYDVGCGTAEAAP
jgi:hypothetical protein